MKRVRHIDGDVSAIRGCLAYDANSGLLRWTVRKSQRVGVGQVAGYRAAGGYVRVEVDGKSYAAHHIAWLLSTGNWPKQEIDHINGRRDDNRLANLRDVSRAENVQNIDALGVTRTRSGKWRAQISVGNRKRAIGTFAEHREAVRAYRLAKSELHPTWRGAEIVRLLQG